MILVTDAAPLIFLSKLDQLGLIPKLFGASIFVPQLVVDEVLRPPVSPDEEQRLRGFIGSIHIVEVHRSRQKTAALSSADLAVHQVAKDQQSDYVLSDDKLLRRLLIADGLTSIGTLGLLVQATEKGYITKKKMRSCLDELIKRHRFRISIELFERILEHLEMI